MRILLLCLCACASAPATTAAPQAPSATTCTDERPCSLWRALRFDDLNAYETRALALTEPAAIVEWQIVADQWIASGRQYFSDQCEAWTALGQQLDAINLRYGAPLDGLTQEILRRYVGAPLSTDSSGAARMWMWNTCARWRGCVTFSVNFFQRAEGRPFSFLGCAWCDARTGCVEFPVPK